MDYCSNGVALSQYIGRITPSSLLLAVCHEAFGDVSFLRSFVDAPPPISCRVAIGRVMITVGVSGFILSGYVATPIIFLAVARCLLEERAELPVR